MQCQLVLVWIYVKLMVFATSGHAHRFMSVFSRRSLASPIMNFRTKKNPHLKFRWKLYVLGVDGCRCYQSVRNCISGAFLAMLEAPTTMSWYFLVVVEIIVVDIL